MMYQLTVILLVLQFCKHFANKNTLFGSENHALHSVGRSGTHVGKNRRAITIGNPDFRSLQNSGTVDLFAADLITLKKKIHEWQFPPYCEDRSWTPVNMQLWGVGGTMLTRKLMP